MKTIIFAILSAMLALTVISCGDDEEEKETTQADVTESLCAMLASCEETAAMAGDSPETCANTVNGIIFPATCEDSFDADAATGCIDETEALSCAEFAAMVGAVSMGQPMEGSCAEMCP